MNDTYIFKHDSYELLHGVCQSSCKHFHLFTVLNWMRYESKALCVLVHENEKNGKTESKKKWEEGNKYRTTREKSAQKNAKKSEKKKIKKYFEYQRCASKREEEKTTTQT